MKPRQELKEGGKKQAGISVDHLWHMYSRGSELKIGKRRHGDLCNGIEEEGVRINGFPLWRARSRPNGAGRRRTGGITAAAAEEGGEAGGGGGSATARGGTKTSAKFLHRDGAGDGEGGGGAGRNWAARVYGGVEEWTDQTAKPLDDQTDFSPPLRNQRPRCKPIVCSVYILFLRDCSVYILISQ
jgi:hypothetical protein